jgi:hypothetical protein
MEAGTKSILKAGPRTGSMVVGDIPPGKEELWVLSRCQGQGQAEIVLEPDVTISNWSTSRTNRACHAR